MAKYGVAIGGCDGEGWVEIELDDAELAVVQRLADEMMKQVKNHWTPYPTIEPRSAIETRPI